LKTSLKAHNILFTKLVFMSLTIS